MPNEFGTWWVDEKTGKKVPGISPRTQKPDRKPPTKNKPPAPTKAKE